MAASTLPQVLETVFANYTDPEPLFAELLPAVCAVLKSDRCFLDVRHPHTRLYRNFCWRSRPDLLDTSTDGWHQEQEWEREDPLFAAALRAKESIFVDDSAIQAHHPHSEMGTLCFAHLTNFDRFGALCFLISVSAHLRLQEPYSR